MTDDRTEMTAALESSGGIHLRSVIGHLGPGKAGLQLRAKPSCHFRTFMAFMRFMVEKGPNQL